MKSLESNSNLEALFHCSMAESSTEANEFRRKSAKSPLARWPIAMSLEGDERGGRKSLDMQRRMMM